MLLSQYNIIRNIVRLSINLVSQLQQIAGIDFTFATVLGRSIGIDELQHNHIVGAINAI